MNSKRLPGKALQSVEGKPLLQYLLERLAQTSLLDIVIVATSNDPSDQPLAEFCRHYGVACYRGCLTNVAGRFQDVVDIYQLDGFVRVNGDSPLLDGRLIDQGVEVFQQDRFDLVTNVLVRTYPKGQSVEVVRSDAFREAYQAMHRPDELEHVTRYFYQNSPKFHIFNFESGHNYGDLQMSVDTAADMTQFANIVARMDKPHWDYSLEELLKFYRESVVSDG